MLDVSKFDNPLILEAGIDEAGRGPLFGRVYTACVILPHPTNAPPELDFSLIKDSKKFTSKKRIKKVYDMIRAHAIVYSVAYHDENHIDKHNILQSTIMCMHDAVKEVHSKLGKYPNHLLVDGTYFHPIVYFDKDSECLEQVPHTCVKSGDSTYASIAAASILAKVERDEYIESLCDIYPALDERYGLRKNKGYGTKQHRDGIAEHGITKWHRKSYAICKDAPCQEVPRHV